MPYRILILFFSFFFLINLALAEEVKKTPEKKVEQKKQNTQKKTTDKKAEQKKSTKPKKKIPYYPKAKKAVVLGKENYQKVNKSLKGLKAVYIDLDGYLKGSKSREMKMPFDVKKKIIAILAKHNIKLLDKNAIKSKFGQPTLKLTPLFPGFLGPYKKGEVRKTYNKECCKGMFMASLTEGARTLRNPDINLELTTWKTMQMTDDCSSLEAWFPNALIKIVEKLVEDKVKAEKKVLKKDSPKKVVLKKQEPKVIKKTVVTEEKKVEKVVEKKVVTRPHVYASQGDYGKTNKQVVIETKVVKETKGVNLPSSLPVRTYVKPVTEVVTQKVLEKQIVPERFTPVITQKEVVCANPSPYEGDEELYRKVVTYERVVPQKVVVVQETQALSVCDKVITMDMEIFRTGSSVIDSSKYFMLDTLVNRMTTCATHRYVIETHADQRGSHAYNDKLTRDRANSIAVYLQSRGIGSHRFETHSFGKRKPINFGTTAADYRENRRVVVTPHKINKK